MSHFTEERTHQLMGALEAAGFMAKHITKLQKCSRLGDILLFLEGRAEIVVEETPIDCDEYNHGDGSMVVTIDRSKPFNPTEFIGEGWSIWRGPADGGGLEGELEQDNRSLAMTEIDLFKIIFFGDDLRSFEAKRTGEERLKHLAGTNLIKLDLGILQSFLDNENRVAVAFNKRDNNNGEVVFYFFDGQTLRNPDGERCTLYLCWNNGEWIWNYDRLSSERRTNSPSVVLAK